MAQTPEESINSVLQALAVFGGGQPDKSALEKANKWLQEFQHTPDSWATCNTLLLAPEIDGQGRVFAAQTFRAKVTHDLHQLDAAQRLGLRDTLLTAIRQYATGPRVVLIQICLALSGLALQMKEWENAVMDVITALGQDPTTVPALLQFLTVLPEEVSSNTRIPMSHEDYRYQEARLLTSNASEILKLLTMYAQAAGVTSTVQTQILKCLRSWINVGEISAGMLAETPLFQFAFECLAFDALFDPAVDMICDLIHETQEVDDNLDVIKQIVPLLVQLRPVLAAAQKADDADKVRGYCRMFTEAGETYRLLVLQHPETFFPIVEAIGECAAYHDLDIVPITFHFWYRLAQSIGKKQSVSPMFHDAYRALMGIIITHLHFPTDPESMTPQERDEFRGFRHVMGDTLKDCCYVLGTDVCLIRTYEMITAAIARGAAGDGTVSWQEIEAPLFAMRSMGAEVDPNDDEVLPKIMDLIPQLPAHPKVRYAATLVISRYSEWTDRHPEYIPFQLQYVSAGFDDPDLEVAAASGQAMKYLCKDCRSHLVEYLPQLHSFVQTVGPKLIQDDRLQVYEAIAYIISSMRMEEAGQALRLFALDLVQQIHTIISNTSPASKEELQKVADCLELLEALLHVVQSFGEELPPACQNTCPEVYVVLDSLIANYGRHYFISERACRVLKLGMQFFGDAGLPVVPQLVSRLSSAFDATGYSSFIWILGKVVGQYGATSDTIFWANLQAGYEAISEKVFSMLEDTPPSDMPDVLEDYSHFVLQLLEYSPEVVLLSASFSKTFQANLTSLTLVHPDVIFPALDFVYSVLGHEALNPDAAESKDVPAKFPLFAAAIRKAVAESGFQMVALILTGLVTHFPEDSTSIVSTIFRIVAGLWPTELATWLPTVLEQVPPSSLAPAAKTQFLTEFGAAVSAGELDRIKKAVVTLNRASKRTRERSRQTALA
ncbi:Nuclear import receptor [Tulasnella sp. 418]|nr:Nuclear import receptor [Tulasnella sp. 418]